MPVPPSPFDAPFEGVLLDLDGTLVDSIAAVERTISERPSTQPAGKGV